MKLPLRGAPAPDVLSKLRLICLEFPETHEEEAWAGIRWSVSRKNFAHAMTIDDGWRARTDWDELELLLKESYRVLAPARLAALVE